jgi:hypothetical protein
MLPLWEQVSCVARELIKGSGVCVLRTRRSRERWSRCFIHDEGRPLEVGVQAQTSNRGKRRRSRVVVVSVAEQGGARLRQVRIKKTNASEPLMTCRKTQRDVETGIETLSRERGGGEPVYGSTGVRHEGGVILIQAWMRNVGTCRSEPMGVRSCNLTVLRSTLLRYGTSASS